MECRWLDITLNHATELKKARFFGKHVVYAVATVSGNGIKVQKERTTTHKKGDINPTWNFPMKFAIIDTAEIENRQILAVKIKAEGLFGSKNLGVVRVHISDLLNGVTAEGKAMQSVGYDVIRKSGKWGGNLNFTYEIGEKFVAKVAHAAQGHGGAGGCVGGGCGGAGCHGAGGCGGGGCGGG